MTKQTMLVMVSAIALTAMSMTMGQSATAMSMNDALEATYENNPRLAAERERVKATNELAPQAFSGWLPTVTANFSSAKEKRQVGSSAEVDDTSRRRTLTLSQPVYTGGATMATMTQAEKQVYSASAALQRVEQDVLFSTIVAYMNVVREREELKLNSNNRAVLKKHLRVTKERFNLGEVTRTDVAQAEARLSLSISEEARAEGRLEISRAEFERLTGIIENGAHITKMPQGLPASESEVREVAIQSNPSIIEAIFNEEAAQAAIKINRASILPSVSLTGNIRRESGTSFAGSSDFEEENLGLNVSIPLYQSGAEYSRVRQSKHNALRLASDRREVENSVTEFATRVWQEYQVSRTTIRSTSDAVKAAQIALEGVIHEAQVGSRTTLDVLDAEQELFKAKVDMVRAQRNEIVAAYNIKAAIGALTAGDLSLNVELFDAHAHYNNIRRKVVGF